MSKADYDVLSTLSEVPGGELRLSDLAAWMLWSRTRLSHHVARMQGRGLVDRVETPEDGRGTVVVLSPEGRRVLEQAAPAHVGAVRACFIDLMTPEQVRVLGEVAHAVVDHLSDGISLNARSAPIARPRSAR